MWNNGSNFFKFDDNYKPTYLRTLTIPEHRKHEKMTARHIIIELFQTSDKEKKILKSAGGKKDMLCVEKKIR